MSRFFFFSASPIRFFRVSPSYFVGISLLASPLLWPATARADEFSILPPGDPIALQLARISPTVTTATTPVSLTRYEAALQTARVIIEVQNREAATVSRGQWRAIATLCGALKNELRQLGVDVEATRALALKNLPEPARAAPNSPRQSAPNQNAPKTLASQTRARSFLAPELVANAAARGANQGSKSGSNGALEVQILPRLRVASALQSAQSASADFNAAERFAPTATKNERAPDFLASQTALSYELSRFLTLRAANSHLDWSGVAGGGAGENPLLGAPLFAGARGASGTGGGVDLSIGAGLKFSTEIEQLRADTGARASRIGGGASLSAFQDRLALNMSLSRLLSEEKGALPSTAAEVGASLDVSPRLSLNLKYQGLFAGAASTSASRVAGGVSLSF